jgi:hypothetical protein
MGLESQLALLQGEERDEGMAVRLEIAQVRITLSLLKDRPLIDDLPCARWISIPLWIFKNPLRPGYSTKKGTRWPSLFVVSSV